MSEAIVLSGLRECPICNKRDLEFCCNFLLVHPDSDGVIRWHVAIQCRCGATWDALEIMPVVTRR